MSSPLMLFCRDPTVRPQGLEVIWRKGVAVGHVRRAEFGHFVEKHITYGYVNATRTQSGHA